MRHPNIWLAPTHTSSDDWLIVLLKWISLGFVKCQLRSSTVSTRQSTDTSEKKICLSFCYYDLTNGVTNSVLSYLACSFWSNPKYSQWTLSTQWNTGKRQFLLKYRKSCLIQTWPLRTWSLATNCDLSARKEALPFSVLPYLPAGNFKSWHL